MIVAPRSRAGAYSAAATALAGGLILLDFAIDGSVIVLVVAATAVVISFVLGLFALAREAHRRSVDVMALLGIAGVVLLAERFTHYFFGTGTFRALVQGGIGAVICGTLGMIWGLLRAAARSSGSSDTTGEQ